MPVTRIDVLVRLERADGSVQLGRVLPFDPRFVVTASPGAYEVAQTYTVLGIEHILAGFDHLLFVLALVILVKGVRRLIATVTAFTVAHSLTLVAATLGWLHVSGPPVEAAIALSIVFVAGEIIRARQCKPGLTQRYPWVVAFTFGLLHGLGFAGALVEVGLPQLSIPVALLFFNVGVEIGQLMSSPSCCGLAVGRWWANAFPCRSAWVVADSALRDRQSRELLGHRRVRRSKAVFPDPRRHGSPHRIHGVQFSRVLVASRPLRVVLPSPSDPLGRAPFVIGIPGLP